MIIPPAVMVHGPDDVRTSLSPGLPLLLLSAVGAAGYAGVGWWRGLVELAVREAPGLVVADLLDCGEAAGRALEALRGGQLRIVLRARPAIFADVAARAARQGGVVIAHPPPALDLAARGAARRVARWLAGDDTTI